MYQLVVYNKLINLSKLASFNKQLLINYPIIFKLYNIYTHMSQMNGRVVIYQQHS